MKAAVIAVHGVGNQEPFDSARQVAALLTDFDPNGTYPAFVEHRVQIPLADLNVAGSGTKSSATIKDRPDYVDHHLKRNEPPPDVSYEFMRNQLSCYVSDGEDRTYETVRLEARRTDGPEVHVYEAYWADLSRLGPGIFAFFTQLYQLILHLPSLGRIAVDNEAVLRPDEPAWRRFAGIQRGTVMILTALIPIINIAMATVVVPVLIVMRACAAIHENGTFVARMPGDVIAIYCVCILTGVVIAGVLLRQFRNATGLAWTVAPILGAAAGYFAARFLVSSWDVLKILVVGGWLIAAVLALLLVRSYSKLRPGTMAFGVPAVILAGALFLWRIGSESSIVAAMMQSFEVINIVLRLAWYAFVPLMLITAATGAWRAWRTSVRKSQAQHVAWIARGTLALPSILFSVVTVAFWAALLKLTEKLLPNEMITLLPIAGSRSGTLRDLVENLFLPPSTFGLVVCAAALAAVTVVGLWSLAPSVVNEVAAPEKQEKSDRQMVTLGRWLSFGGYAILAVITGLLLFWTGLAVFVAERIPAGSVWQHIARPNASVPSGTVLTVGTFLLGMIVVRKWLPAARAALDIALDVDNYMREHPSSSTPRARFAERFLSLFEHVAAQNYDRIVIVAHSQGCVITVDLLRFFRQRLAAFESKTTLFTMGNPLRQLYAFSFPPLYTWTEQPPNAPGEHDLGIVEWVNAYRTGDYVGRWVWRGSSDPNVWRRCSGSDQSQGAPLVFSSPTHCCEEICIGAGAHTHYWDQTAGDIAAMLDHLINNSLCQRKADEPLLEAVK